MLGVLFGIAVLGGLLGGLAFAQHRGVIRRAWPLGLGTLEGVPSRYPPIERTRAAAQLIPLAGRLGVNLTPLAETPVYDVRVAQEYESLSDDLAAYLAQEAMRTNATIGELPREVASFLSAHATELDAVRAHLLRGEIRWAFALRTRGRWSELNPDGHVRLHRLLIASALDKARRNDRAAWDDLHAEWQLTRSLWQAPDLMSVSLALQCARRTNAIARKLPLPEPAWLSEPRDVDARMAMLASHQAATWAFLQNPRGLARSRIANAILRPYAALCSASYADASRRFAARVAETRDCDVDRRDSIERMRRSMPSWNVLSAAPSQFAWGWQNVHRFRAESEATQRIQELRAGFYPQVQSTCTEGEWVYGEGTMRFSATIPPDDNWQTVDVPLEWNR